MPWLAPVTSATCGEGVFGMAAPSRTRGVVIKPLSRGRTARPGRSGRRPRRRRRERIRRVAELIDRHHGVPAPSALDPVDVTRLHRCLAAHRAERETPSDDTALLAEGLAHLEEWATRRLGPPARRALHEASAHGSALTVEHEGTGPPLTLLAHYDTVWSAGTLQDRPVRVEGDRVSGPGVFDMKAGLVQAVWAVRALRAAGVAHPPLRLLLTGDEEIGSPFSRPIIEAACADAAAVLVFEASAAGGAVRTARKGVGLFDVHVRGV